MLEYEQEDAGCSGENTSTLLDADMSLFPGGTKVFPSKYHFQKRSFVLIGCAVGFSVLCLLVSIVSGHDTDVRSSVTKAFLILFVLGNGLLLLLLYVWNQQDLTSYKEKVDSGLWLEGVFVFSTGDVVVRFNEIFRKVEMEFDSGTISEAVARVPDNQLVICYTDLRGIKQEFKVDCSRLVDTPAVIAACINGRERDGYGL